LLLALSSAGMVAAQNAKTGSSLAQASVAIRSIRMIAVNDGYGLEIISDHPLVPSIGKLENPARIVIDLPNAHLANYKKRLAFHDRDVAAVRIGQFQESMARIVVDLAQPLNYSWDVAGNRLTVRLYPPEGTPKATSVPGFTPEGPAAVLPVSSSGSEAVTLPRDRLASGSSITAGSDTAVLTLGRGGEVRVCPGTTVSVTPSNNGHSLMLGMSTGALEAHYRLDASSDSILTPDFRILLAGPGEFHYAVSADQRGNTCVQALPGNTASVIVSELLGDGTYQVTPAQQVLFHTGLLKTAASAVGSSCGCPAPRPATMLASSPAEGEKTDLSFTELSHSVKNGNAPAGSVHGDAARAAETAALPPSKPNDVHVQVDVPFVFRANDPASDPQAGMASMGEAERLPLRNLPRPGWFQLAALPPARAPHHGFFGKVKGFFSAIFG
jgi:AMIN domain